MTDASGIRDLAMGIYPLIFVGQGFSPKLCSLKNAITRIEDGLCYPGTRKKKPMDVPEMIAKWTEIVIVLSTAHDKAAIDRAEYSIDTVMLPLLTAPVRELRKFCAGLVIPLSHVGSYHGRKESKFFSLGSYGCTS